MFQSYRAAEKVEDQSGAFIFTVGFGLKETVELAQISSHPLAHYHALVNDEGRLNTDLTSLVEQCTDLYANCYLKMLGYIFIVTRYFDNSH